MFAPEKEGPYTGRVVQEQLLNPEVVKINVQALSSFGEQ